MKVNKTTLPGVLTIHPEIFEDYRGRYIEIYNQKMLKKNGVNIKFVQDDICISQKHVLRGIHGDDKTWKLISCPNGTFMLAIVNCDKKSSNFGQSESFILSDKNHMMVLVPPKYGNAHLVLSEQATFHYKQSTFYIPNRQFTYRFDDPRFNIRWPIKDPILSRRDDDIKPT
jgi:dTDP-4-dehydrorhamnose 3,5-epimerase